MINWLVVTLILLLLASIVAGVAWAPVTYLNSHYLDRYFRVWVDQDRAWDYGEVMAFAQRLDRLIDRIERDRPAWYPPATDDYAYAWAAELAPMYHYEGAASVVNYPLISFQAARHGGRHNHVAGSSNCKEYFVLNLRFANPVSTWSERGAWIATLAHELAHNHQGLLCYEQPRELIETSAQLMSWEVLAGLANQGNEMALFALLDTLRGDALSMAWGLALADGNLDQFERDLRQLYGGDLSRWSRYQKSKRFWAHNMEELTWILTTYSAQPLNLVQRHRFGGAIPHLAVNTDSADLVIDDLLYVLANAEALVINALRS